ncbi:MAG: methylenetetrahydrofolate reductase [NAD(P)H] [Spirochaetales bacterium]|nr:methylenetetrahydrofolate reductase [NAD(P)H] [Spirochaetales bacterium]
MHIKDILSKNKTSFSYEFFPPRTKEASDRLFTTIQQLSHYNPSYVSVTYGAGGSTRELTHNLIIKIRKQIKIPVVSHLTCIGSSKTEILGILEKYNRSGIENILAIRGDQPQASMAKNPIADGFTYAAELVAFIKKHFPRMGIGVAGYPEGHPQTPNRLEEIELLKQKVDAGADYICTQLFFDNRDFYDFRERCELAGIKVPIIAGIMPVTSLKSMQRIAELAAGARIPAKLLKAIYRVKDPSLVENVGIHWATEQVLELLDNGVKGIHFYTLNRSNATLRIYQSLGITNIEQVSG